MPRIYHLLIGLLAAASHAQYTIDWSHPAADTYKNGLMAARDTSDNVIVVGTRTSSVGAANIYTQKYDKTWGKVRAAACVASPITFPRLSTGAIKTRSP